LGSIFHEDVNRCVCGVKHVQLTDVVVFTADLNVAAALSVAQHGFGPAVVQLALGFQVPTVDVQVSEQNVAIFACTHELVVRTAQTLDAVHVRLVPAVPCGHEVAVQGTQSLVLPAVVVLVHNQVVPGLPAIKSITERPMFLKLTFE